jgi:hypothetical protein
MPNAYISSEARFCLDDMIKAFEAEMKTKLTPSQAIVFMYKSCDFPGLGADPK